MDSLVAPLVAQYLSMSNQARETEQKEQVDAVSKEKHNAGVSLGGQAAQDQCPPGRTPCPPSRSVALGPLSRGASWDELLQACFHSFDAEGGLCGGSHLLNITLTMHRILTSPADLLARLAALFKTALEDERPAECQQICYFIRYWIQEFWVMFCLHDTLEGHLEQFRDLLRETGQEGLCDLLETQRLGERDWSRKASQRIKANISKKRKVSLLFDHLEPIELAEHLTYLEFKSFCKISFADYQDYVRTCCMKESTVMGRSVALCNGISQWVQLMVLSRPTAPLRAEVFTKFIHVAQNLHQMHNFNTLMAVVGGLCHSSISRLKDTSSHVTSDATKVLNEMTELLSSSRNYENYRQAYGRRSGFKLPILGVHLKDLISVNEAMADYVEEGKINVQKLQTMFHLIHDLIQLQQNPPHLDANKDLVHLLTLSLDLYDTENEIYELSYTREPRNCKAPPATPSRPPVVVDWASGVAPKPDPRTIGKHVQRMVDSVFINYDHNENGFISQDDFEKIAASFPFSFCVMDKEKEGQISREEITAYFMRASVICSKLGLGFVHNFQETTYMKPTFCDNCSGFLWGVIKQGYRCRDCGMNCHKLCKDQVAFECKKKSSSQTDSSSTATDHAELRSSEVCAPGQLTPQADEAAESFDWSKRSTPGSPAHPSTPLALPLAPPPVVGLSKATQTEVEWAGSGRVQTEAGLEDSGPVQACLLTPCPQTPPTPSSCPSPLPMRRRAYAEWENRAHAASSGAQEHKPSYEDIEKENQSLQRSNESLRRKVREMEREVEILEIIRRRRALHLVEEDSSS